MTIPWATNALCLVSLSPLLCKGGFFFEDGDFFGDGNFFGVGVFFGDGNFFGVGVFFGVDLLLFPRPDSGVLAPDSEIEPLVSALSGDLESC